MPRGDGTGPLGTGPAAGRRGAYCAGNGTFGYGGPSPAKQPANENSGYGNTRGFARRNRFNSASVPFCRTFDSGAGVTAPLDRETEIAFLKADAANLEKRLREINERVMKLSEEK